MCSAAAACGRDELVDYSGRTDWVITHAEMSQVRLPHFCDSQAFVTPDTSKMAVAWRK